MQCLPTGRDLCPLMSCPGQQRLSGGCCPGAFTEAWRSRYLLSLTRPPSLHGLCCDLSLLLARPPAVSKSGHYLVKPTPARWKTHGRRGKMGRPFARTMAPPRRLVLKLSRRPSVCMYIRGPMVFPPCAGFHVTYRSLYPGLSRRLLRQYYKKLIKYTKIPVRPQRQLLLGLLSRSVIPLQLHAHAEST